MKISGDSFCLGEKESLLETQKPPSQARDSYYYSTSLGNALPGPPTTRDSTLPVSGPAVASADCTQQGTLGCTFLFSEEVLGRDSNSD